LDFDRAREYVDSLLMFGMKLGLANMEALLDKLDHPEKGLEVIHVAGTNGKGSVTAALHSILHRSGRKVGMYTSPHLFDVRERMVVNGRKISRDDFARIIQTLKETSLEVEAITGAHPTYFEVLTAAALVHFREACVDTAVLEVGMGGRLDATNAVSPAVTCITPVSLDHQIHLGNTVEKIAAEKAGILKSGVPLYMGKQTPEAREVILDRADDLGISARELSIDFSAKIAGSSIDGLVFDYRDHKGVLKGLHSPLLGTHQVDNLVLATAVARGMGIDDRSIRIGLERLRWPARMQLADRDPVTVLDCSHNIAGMETLAAGMDLLFPYEGINLLFACLEDRKPVQLLEPLRHRLVSVTFTQIPDIKARAPHSMEEDVCFTGWGIQTRVIEDPWEALLQVRKNTGDDQIALATGSIYYVGPLWARWTGAEDTDEFPL